VTVLGQEGITNGDKKEEGGKKEGQINWLHLGLSKTVNQPRKPLEEGRSPQKKTGKIMSRCFFKINRNLKV
jgi:hypothetical protein